MAKRVSVIIPCKNEEKTITLLLNALKEQNFGQSEMEIIIADAMSDDDTRQAVRNFQNLHPEMDIQIVDNPKIHIPCGLNVGIQSSQGEIIIRMDAHSVPHKDYVALCVSGLDENRADNVGGVWDIKPLTNTTMAKAIADAASHPVGVGNARYRYTNKSGYVDTVPFGAFKRDLFDRIGLFDETLLTNEDYEFNERIRQNGGKIWLNPEICSNYFARKNLRELSRQYWRYGLWKSQMIKRYPKSLRMRQILPPLFIIFLILLGIASSITIKALFLLGIVLTIYSLTLFIVGIQLALKKKMPPHLLNIPLAIATMHFSWGCGFIYGLLRKI
jgi:glycosyltransferase involved in cell wall biosynthesis